MKNYLTRYDSNDWGLGLFDGFFEDFFKPTFSRSNALMKTDVKEIDGAFELSVDMPGVEKEDIKLTLNNGYLTIEAKREEKQEDKYIRRERSAIFNRSYYVGNAIVEEDVKAKYDKGILTLTIPKKDAKKIEKKNIQID